jgi:hypothetical protein
MGGVQLFPKAFQPFVSGAWNLAYAPFYLLLGLFNIIVGIVLLPFGD